MSWIRFNHVFFSLMLLSILCAFVISPRITDRAKAGVSNIFVPVAWPANLVGGWIHDVIAGRAPRDDGSPDHPRSNAELVLENRRLLQELANLTGQIERLQASAGEGEQLGEIRKFCTPFRVAGADPGGREALLLAGSSFDGLRVGMPVLCTHGVAGLISRAGVGGAQVQLITDPGFKPIEIAFGRPTGKPDGTPAFQYLSADRFLAKGVGNRALIVERISVERVKEIELRLNDWAVFSDRDWPMATALAGSQVGIVKAITPSREPGFAQVRIETYGDLLSLREVMVVNKEKEAER